MWRSENESVPLARESRWCVGRGGPAKDILLPGICTWSLLIDCCPKGVLQLSPTSGSTVSFDLAAEVYFARSYLELLGLLKCVLKQSVNSYCEMLEFGRAGGSVVLSFLTECKFCPIEIVFWSFFSA